MSAAVFYQDIFPPLLPKDPLGQHFTKYFHHGWHFIEAETPDWGKRPSWRTETRYPLEVRNLWSKYQDPQTLLGLRFGTYTNYLLLDIDRKSKNHPENNRQAYEGILEVMESIGLCRGIPISSSESGGLHMYYFLPHYVHSFTLAVTIKQALVEAGYSLSGGQLEVFPNAKAYNPQKPTNFNAHRLPLQQNSYLLDWDLAPISSSISTFLNQADFCASNQYMATLSEAMEQAKGWYKKKCFSRRGRTSAEQFRSDLEDIISEGWTGFGQTNDLLITFAKYGIIFLCLEGEELVEYMLRTTYSCPGYQEFCRHQHEIERRVREVALWASEYYYPYPGNPPRNKTYKEQFKEAAGGKNNVIPLHPGKKLQLATIERVKSVVAMLKGAGEFPETVYKRTQAIINKSKAAFGIGFSQKTLHKAKYLPLWHPAHENIADLLEEEEGVNADSVVEKYSILPDPWEGVTESPKPVQLILSSDLHPLPPNEGLLLPPAKGGQSSEEEGKSQAFDSSCQLQVETEVSEQTNQLEKIVFCYLATFHVLRIITTINPQYSSFLIQTIQQIEFSFSEISDKYFLCLFDREPPKKEDKPDLSLAETITETRLDEEKPTEQEVAESSQSFTPLQHREAIRLRLQYQAQSRKQVRVFCNSTNISLMPRQRADLEQLVLHRLMQQSSSPILQQEADEWFATHKEITTQAESFQAFWDFSKI